MTSGLEDKIISYFDGELSDADSAELLHRVSISPEIRDLFREHEMLRSLAREATHSIMIRPEVEANIFSRVEALAGSQTREKAMFVFSRRTAMALALAIILISGSLGYFVPKIFSGNQQATASNQIIQSHDIVQEPPVQSPINSTFAPKEPSIAYNSNRLGKSTYRTDKSYSSDRTSDPLVTDNNTILTTDKDPELLSINPLVAKAENIQSNIGSERHSPFDQIIYPSESRQLFDISLQTSSGFTYPADQSPVKPFADQRLSIAYHLTENNLVGIRIASGLYQQLGTSSRTTSYGTVYLDRTMQSVRSFSEELYLSHLVPVFIGAPFFLEFTVDAGIIPNGSFYGTEAGIRIPISENIMFDGAFALSRIHSNVPTSDQLLSSENSGKPVILSGPDVHTTLNGRLYYGLLYKF